MEKNQSMKELQKKYCKMPRLFQVTEAELIKDFCIKITFSNGYTRTIDFYQWLSNNLKGYYKKYLEPKNFKNFKIEHGNIVWGKDWDLIFHLDDLYKGKL
ncbi:DUF2442 domain-containing protein [bacterium]|nr:DUF2442 domain-containing protein [bacterium]